VNSFPRTKLVLRAKKLLRKIKLGSLDFLHILPDYVPETFWKEPWPRKHEVSLIGHGYALPQDSFQERLVTSAAESVALDRDIQLSVTLGTASVAESHMACGHYLLNGLLPRLRRMYTTWPVEPSTGQLLRAQ
jgi:hypothetical protein